MAKLSYEEYLATFGDGVKEHVSPEAPASVSFWSYFDEIPIEDFDGYDCSEGHVENVYRLCAGQYEHVLVNSEDKNVFMVIVLDVDGGKVHGHHLLNLKKLYGLSDGNNERVN